MSAILFLLVLALSLYPPDKNCYAATNSDFSLVAGGTINYNTLDIQIGRSKFSPRLVTLDFAVTGIYRNCYATLNYDKSIQDDYIYDFDAISGDDTIMVISRRESGLSLGCSLRHSISVFGGYLDGKTSIIRPGNFGAVGGAISPEFFNALADFTMTGPFIGAGYSMPLGEKTTLFFNIAYAGMDGEFLAINGVGREKINGKTSGFSYGVGISAPIVNKVNFRAGFKARRYEFDDTDFIPGVTQDNFSHDENFSMFFISVSNEF